MVNVRKLQARLLEAGLTTKDAATQLGINRSTFYRKLQKPDELLSVRDIRVLSDMLGLRMTDVAEIFFSQDVA